MELLGDPLYKPMRLREIGSLLRLDKSEKKELFEVLDELCAQGKAEVDNKGRYSKASGRHKERGKKKERFKSEKKDRNSRERDRREEYREEHHFSEKDGTIMEGTFIGHYKGFGFVEVEDQEQDIFIPENDTGSAMHQDKVQILVRNGHKEGKRPEGIVLKVLERGMPSIVGTYQSSRDYGFVISDNPKFSKDIFISRKNSMGAKDGDKVVVEVTDYGSRNRKPEGKVTEEAINAACRRILEAKYKLGLFDNPYKYCDVKRAKKQIFTKEHRAVARKIASESLVLLKNEGNVLPLAKKGTIAVVGPLADSRSNMPGTWSVAAVLKNATSLAEGLKAVAGGKAEILTAKGCNLMSDAEYEKRATMFGRSLHRDNRSDKELLDEALAVAAKSDVIVAALGESSEMSGESSCRTNLEMTDTQRILLQELLKTGKPVVLVLFTGRPLVLNWEQANVPAILNVWFAGSEAGFAIGDVLFGDVNPSGKLTTTFPKSVGQIPLFYNHKNTGRPLADGAWFQKFRSNYIDIDNEPLYPFGFGLSYTTFSYSDVALDKTSMTDKGELTATVTVTNTGKRDGAEVVQLYIRDLVGSVTRPVKELKGFEKIFLKAGESKKVSFKITPELLKFYNYNLDFVCEPGDFEVMIGRSCRDVKKAAFKLL